MLERIKDVLIELGKGFSFVGNQYKISTLENDYYIDLLFYYLELRCYIVIELKTTDELDKYISKDILESLPTEEELYLHIDIIE